MKNKKGFTLVELIAVIALLGVILLIVVPNIVNTFNKGKEKAFVALVQDVYRQAEKDYTEDYAYDGIRPSYCTVDIKNSASLECKELSFNDQNLKYYVTLGNNGKVTNIGVSNGEYCYYTTTPSIEVNEYRLYSGSYLVCHSNGECYCEGGR